MKQYIIIIMFNLITGKQYQRQQLNKTKTKKQKTKKRKEKGQEEDSAGQGE